MKIIDKTPLVNEKGELGTMERIQGMFKFGFNWPRELEAQKAIINFFERQLEKGYTLIRNITLGASGITVPLILLGPAGIYVINITYLRGRYEAKGNTWNEASGDGYKPASVNLVQQTARMATAVKVFIERQGTKLPIDIEPVLLAGDPGLHIESARPAVKVLMIDGIKSFASGLATARPVLSVDAVHDFAERLVDPRPLKKETPERRASAELKTEPPPQSPQEVSRARAIFSASAEAKPFNPAELDFAMQEEPAAKTPPASVIETSPAQPLPRPAVPRKKFLGLSTLQLILVAVLTFAFLCVLAVLAYLLIFGLPFQLP